MKLYRTCVEPLFIVNDLYVYRTVWNPYTQILVYQDLELYETHIEPVTTFDLEMYGTCMEPLYKQE